MLTLAVTRFEVDPAKVTEILDLEPTSVVREGEINTSGRPSKFNGWWLEAHPERLEQGLNHEQAIDALIECMRDRPDHFARLREEIRPQILTIYGGFYVPKDSQSGVWLSADQMAVLSSCGVEWGLDLFRVD
jgi:hypothetical protein